MDFAAAKVGGIPANHTYPADFNYQSLIIEANVIKAARRHALLKANGFEVSVPVE